MKDTRPWKKSEIAKRFRALRRKAYFTQSRLGELIRLSRKCVCQIETGSVMPHCGTWDRFVDLEQKHYRPKVEMPTNWD